MKNLKTYREFLNEKTSIQLIPKSGESVDALIQDAAKLLKKSGIVCRGYALRSPNSMDKGSLIFERPSDLEKGKSILIATYGAGVVNEEDPGVPSEEQSLGIQLATQTAGATIAY